MHAFGCVNKFSGVFFFNFARFVPSAAEHAWVDAGAHRSERRHVGQRGLPGAEGGDGCHTGHGCRGQQRAAQRVSLVGN